MFSPIDLILFDTPVGVLTEVVLDVVLLAAAIPASVVVLTVTTEPSFMALATVEAVVPGLLKL